MEVSLENFFQNGDHSYWIVADPVRVPDIRTFLYQHEPKADVITLLNGPAFEHLNEVSPIASPIEATVALKARLIEDGVFSSSCIFLKAETQIENDLLSDHLRALLTVVVEEYPSYFRYYSSTFWHMHSSDISKRDLDSILGPFSSLAWFTSGSSLFSVIFPKHVDAENIKKATSPIRLHSAVFKELV
ncbi:DUF4123 domain-containing protein [Enterovibrio norvegicus]|uniref:DUF4123 domain-containing protein n=1 Tax=Enterovibrio norvegicus TaxID=188144 RepID=UPI000C856646|nr:DUF4123 domain-containing protein [Enterovibrio norvegicus]PMN67156.1 hypothetical protein BCT27_24255 [Enterovibrio norvegicus]